MKLFLGVDGGQSGTAAVIGDETGRILGAGEAGPCNHAAASEGRAKLERAVTGSVAAACAQAGLDGSAVRFEAACFGMSGGPDDKREILANTLRVNHLLVTTDAVIALSGATRTGQGIITIAGTGSIAFGRNPAGRTTRAGGWGYVFGDEGGGFDIARQAARAVLRLEEGWGPSTALRETLLAATGSENANEMLHRFYTDEWPRSRVATLARLVDAAAEQSDAVAVAILRGAAQQLALLAGAVREELWSPGSAVELAYIGGVFRSRMLLESFRMLVESQDGVRCSAPLHGPAEGALREAYRSAGLEKDIEGRT
jgi:N-acetylglucosamine kinase-like BadF-type ATPase